MYNKPVYPPFERKLATLRAGTKKPRTSFITPERVPAIRFKGRSTVRAPNEIWDDDEFRISSETPAFHNLNTYDTVGILSGITTAANNAPSSSIPRNRVCRFPWDDIAPVIVESNDRRKVNRGGGYVLSCEKKFVTLDVGEVGNGLRVLGEMIRMGQGRG